MKKISAFLNCCKYIACDLVSVVIMMYLSLGIYNFFWGLGFFYTKYLSLFTKFLPLTIAIVGISYLIFGLYNKLWKYFGTTEIISIIAANIVSGGLLLLAHFIFKLFNIQYLFTLQIIIFSIFMTCASFLVRVIPRLYLNMINFKRNSSYEEENTMVIGAGSACDMFLHELSVKGEKGSIKCIIDDDPHKHGLTSHGVPIVGGREYIKQAVEKYDIKRIIFAIPSISDDDKYEILRHCKNCCSNVKSIPDMSSIVNGVISITSLTEIDPEMLLGRDPIHADIDKIAACVNGKVVLVTGGGGSIGSELCRQIARYSPKALIILDIYENNAYEIQQELFRKMPDLDLYVEIASVRDEKRLEYIFNKYKPELVFHAAAHKHVPLMESSPIEAVKNNVFGTLNTVKASHASGVKKFVLISTDKAVNPTNIMGATKRICEMIVQSYNKKSDTEFVAVRFGNVLGSNGSVIPLFLNQIKNGGPVTVTHAEIIRYFMTIPEAVSLVLQAANSAKGGEIYVLNMGSPVKILKLAENLIKLCGYVPYKDIEIKFTGLRPGEKLYEELLMAEEGLTQTDNSMIFIGKSIEMDEEKFSNQLDELHKLIGDESSDIKQYVSEIVTTYRYVK